MNTDDERTIVSSDLPAHDATVAFTPGDTTVALGADAFAAGERTQMAVSVQCPVCHTTNPPGETYCADCGFLLSSAPAGAVEEVAAPGARLVAGDGREFTLSGGSNAVGRINADVLLADASVSRAHASVVLEEGRCFVEDLGSTNGTKVNGQRLEARQPRDLRDGDEVIFGSVALRVALPEGYSAAAPEATAAPGAAPASPAAFTCEESGAEYPIPVGTTAIGRRSANDLAFPTDAFMSGRHAQVAFDGTALTLTDIGSTNGTVVNDDRLVANEPMALQEGDLVVMGHQRLRVRIAPPQAEEVPAAAEEPAEPEPAGAEEIVWEMPEEDDTPA